MKYNFGPTDAVLRIDMIKAFGKPGGLPVEGAEEIVQGVNELTEEAHAAGALIIDVQDWHYRGHYSFASTHGVPPFSIIKLAYGDQTAWTDHAVPGTTDVDWLDNLIITLTHLIIRKGYNREVDSYSAFFENDHVTKTGLAGYLRDKGIKRLFVVGLAYDFCVGYTAIDGIKEGFEVIVIKNLTRGIGMPIPLSETDGHESTTIDLIERHFDVAGVKVVEDLA